MLENSDFSANLTKTGSLNLQQILDATLAKSPKIQHDPSRNRFLNVPKKKVDALFSEESIEDFELTDNEVKLFGKRSGLTSYDFVLANKLQIASQSYQKLKKEVNERVLSPKSRESSTTNLHIKVNDEEQLN